EPITQVTSEPVTTPENRWIVAGHHRTRFDDGALMYLEVLRISDDNFLREIHAFSSNNSSDISIRSTRYTKSSLGTIKTWEGGDAPLDTRAYRDLIAPQQFPLNRLPRISAEHAIPLLGGLAVARLPGEAVDFQRSTAYDGFRLDLAPELYVPFHFDRYLFGSLRGNLRETAYHMTNNN